MDSLTIHNQTVRPSRKADKAIIRRRVLKAANIAFRTKGIKAVRMDDLAAELSISKRTIYQLFHDKEELLFEIVKKNAEEIKAYLSEVGEHAENVLVVVFKFYQQNMEQLNSINVKFLEDLERYPRILKYIKSIKKENSKYVDQFYQEGVNQGLFIPNVKFRIITVMFDEQMENVLHSDLLQTYTLTDIYKTVLMALLRGACTAKGVKLIDDYFSNSPENFN
ncbi:MAG: TetR/AcrR family transcriptional regulator [Phocaeicola sp.]|uniref:TetR/AcrR family transcriptional regulator n=1 Tax=Phocaeicola TaxID=909656 RepID=UPI00234ECC9C|nr:TetR/AcrR family transcriptional regulator [Phocaeicola oris]MCE2617083.1 TetR/AcrR family transcriptional regulator [Phocaeicola oris]